MTTATTGLANKKSPENAYTSGWNDGVPGVHPGHTPYMNIHDWGGLIMGCPTWMTGKNHPAVGNWPYSELYYNTRYVYAANEFTPQQSMRGKAALYGYLYAISSKSSDLPDPPEIPTDYLDFDTYVVTKWNNTLMLNLRQLETDGYNITGCKWYKNNGFLKDGFTYSAGARKNDVLEAGATYYFELETSNHGTVRSTNKKYPLRSYNMFAFPNPVSTGGTLYVETDEAGIPIQIYNQNGTCVKQLIATGGLNAIRLDIQAGAYILKTGAEEIKIIVK